MRLHRRVPMLAAAAAAAALAAPSAQAMPNHGVGTLGTYPSEFAHHPGGSTDWALIGAGAAGSITLLGAGIATQRRTRRKPPLSPRATSLGN
jgi:hypothetical protein